MSKNKNRRDSNYDRPISAKEKVISKQESRINALSAVVTLLGVYITYIAYLFFIGDEILKSILSQIASVSYIFANLLAIIGITLGKFNQQFVHRNICILNLFAFAVVVLIYAQAQLMVEPDGVLRYSFIRTWPVNILLQIIYVVLVMKLASQKTYVIKIKYNKKSL